MSSAPRVRVIALGGTIASTRDPAGRAHPRLGGEQVVAGAPGLVEVADLDVETVEPVPSCEIGWARVLEVVDRIERARRDQVDGVVITQGTDTIEETSYAWDLLVPAGVAVVVTGAMRHTDQPGADGPANLLDAVRVAAAPAAKAHGVLVSLAGDVHPARSVRKRHTSSVSAFGSPNGPVGTVAEDRVYLGPPPHQRSTLAVPVDASAVPRPLLVSVSFDDEGWWLPAAQVAPGLVIEGFGGGHLPSQLAGPVARLAGRIPVVLASRAGAGHVLRKTYGGFAGAETELLAAGLIPAGDLDGLKARIALSLMLAQRMTINQIAEMFGELDTLTGAIQGAILV